MGKKSVEELRIEAIHKLNAVHGGASFLHAKLTRMVAEVQDEEDWKEINARAEQALFSLNALTRAGSALETTLTDREKYGTTTQQ